jgi:hypothetical protein
MGTINIDGWELTIENDLAIAIFRTITEIIRAGAVEVLTFRAKTGDVDEDALTWSIVISPTTRVRLHVPDDVATLALAGDLPALARKYGVDLVG